MCGGWNARALRKDVTRHEWLKIAVLKFGMTVFPKQTFSLFNAEFVEVVEFSQRSKVFVGRVAGERIAAAVSENVAVEVMFENAVHVVDERGVADRNTGRAGP